MDMDRLENKKDYAIFVKFLKTHAIEFVTSSNQIQFERGQDYTVVFDEEDVILCDGDKSVIRKGTVFEVMEYFTGFMDIYV